MAPAPAILIRLPTLEDLGRACVACPTFRRVITDHSFLRRIRALHPQLLLGILSDSFIPAEPPHPSSSAARTFSSADAIDFSCSFLPSPDCWRLRDLRDGRLLFSAVPEGAHWGYERCVFVIRDLAVCDPIHRRYILLPAIPDDLAALVNQEEIVEVMTFLASADDEDERGTSFSVICVVLCKTSLLVFHISCGSGQCRASEFDGWGALAMEIGNSDPHFVPYLIGPYYAHRCFCWVIHWTDKLLVLNARAMEFSSMDLPPVQGSCQRAIVEAGKGMFGIFTLRDASVLTYQLVCTVSQNDDHSANQKEPLVTIPLPLNYGYIITGVAAGYLLLQGIPGDLNLFPSTERPNVDYFSLNLKTFKLERFCGAKLISILCQTLCWFSIIIVSTNHMSCLVSRRVATKLGIFCAMLLVWSWVMDDSTRCGSEMWTAWISSLVPMVVCLLSQ